MVISELESQLRSAVGVCTCQDCVLDMAAFALNNVKPAYLQAVRVAVLNAAFNLLTSRAFSS